MTLEQAKHIKEIIDEIDYLQTLINYLDKFNFNTREVNEIIIRDEKGQVLAIRQGQFDHVKFEDFFRAHYSYINRKLHEAKGELNFTLLQYDEGAF